MSENTNSEDASLSPADELPTDDLPDDGQGSTSPTVTEKQRIPKLGDPPPQPASTGPSAVRFTVRFLLFIMLACAGYAFWVGINQRRTNEQLRIVAPLKEYGAAVNLWKGEVSRISLRYNEKDGAFDPEVLSSLAKLPKLKRLVLMDTADDGGMLEQIGKIESLEELLIFNANLSTADLAPLTKLKSLRVLWLCDCRLTDTTLDPFAENNALLALRHLNLNDNQLTDNGLLRLGSLIELEQVNLANNDITDNGVNIVKQTLVNARIIREPIAGYQP